MEEMMETVSTQRVCSSCGTTNSGSGKFCIKCGALLLPASSSQTSKPNVSAPVETESAPLAQPAQREGKITYDPRIIERFAVRLYRTATIVIVFFTLIGLAGGGFGGYGLASWGDNEVVYAAAGALVLGGISFWIGWEIAFRLKLRAQLALCQVQIEENSR